MCGIAGIFSYSQNVTQQRPFIDWALKSMHHRGPDSSGVWTNGQNYMAGFVRLSIRDLSENGSQPMLSADGQYALSFNGELYNSDVFKKQLQNEGYHFRSSTDTEVLLYGLIHWGEKYVLENYDGIFAFAFYSQNKNTLLLARDRSGVKPLYFGASSQGIIYSSQYDHVINHHFIKDNPLHEGALGAYIALGYVPENNGIVTNTFLLPHGYYLLVNEDGFSKMPFYNYSLQKSAKQEKSLEQILEESVQSQLVSDVPVGTFMSGGVDSPLVSYYANKHHRIKSFTIGVDDENMNESCSAQAYADILKTQHFCKNITAKDLLETIDDNTKAFSEPFADYSSIPTLILSKFARQQVTVALSGDGGDELFWGYPRNLRMLNESRAFRQSKFIRLINFTVQKVKNRKRSVLKRHLEVSDFPAYYYRSLFITGAEEWLPGLYENNADPAFFLYELYKEKNVENNSLNNSMNIVRKLEFDLHLQRILLKVDRASMYHSLEVRVPMLSNAMVDYSRSLHHIDCIQNGYGKYNLKQLLISKSNAELVLQPKKGFGIPIGHWLRNELRSDVEDKLMNMPSELEPLFNKKELHKLLQQHNAGTQDIGWLIWSLYALVNWNNQHRNAC